MSKSMIIGAVVLLAAAVSPAAAQSEADFVAAFAGQWQTLDPSYTDEGACRLDLKPDAVESGYDLDASRCGGALSDLVRWSIVNNQLALVRADGDVVALMGGNQTRLSGDTADGNVVFDRIVETAPPRAASAGAQPSCVYLGYTASCAKPDDLTAPQASAEDGVARAAVLVALNARSQAKSDADVVATIPANTCVVVDECTTQDGVNWCRAQVANFSGWIRQQAVRSDRWPVLTYRPSCKAAR
ncbi:AprI/Inh family metalloprotease inhibitor [Fulvimarina sp. 2208YS6-2-32]|uniref:AprI/Inh family metalloprotease inhibitor n=1 Tax=Fulvimarina uroteuthidis TaxID=3098149 RepID=A0ABU5HYX0_9HYPH|nr:AprI/Inh family metalloprotease inhibitor [Fulvimarina sp. 2208YS6-2-32]MDY8108315.1 AprI/Inh family metalloprotease inhibitor [Fulvimarina sp. 2208YS6-2-32]